MIKNLVIVLCLFFSCCQSKADDEIAKAFGYVGVTSSVLTTVRKIFLNKAPKYEVVAVGSPAFRLFSCDTTFVATVVLGVSSSLITLLSLKEEKAWFWVAELFSLVPSVVFLGNFSSDVIAFCYRNSQGFKDRARNYYSEIIGNAEKHKDLI